MSQFRNLIHTKARERIWKKINRYIKGPISDRARDKLDKKIIGQIWFQSGDWIRLDMNEIQIKVIDRMDEN